MNEKDDFFCNRDGSNYGFPFKNVCGRAYNARRSFANASNGQFVDGIISDTRGVLERYKITKMILPSLKEEIKDAIIDFFVLSREMSESLQALIDNIYNEKTCEDCNIYLLVSYFDIIKGPQSINAWPRLPVVHENIRKLASSLIDLNFSEKHKIMMETYVPGMVLLSKEFNIKNDRTRGGTEAFAIHFFAKESFNQNLLFTLLDKLIDGIKEIDGVVDYFKNEESIFKMDYFRKIVFTLTRYLQDLGTLKEDLYTALRNKDTETINSYCSAFLLNE